MQIREPDFQIKKNPDDPCRFWQALLKVGLPTFQIKKMREPQEPRELPHNKWQSLPFGGATQRE